MYFPHSAVSVLSVVILTVGAAACTAKDLPRIVLAETILCIFFCSAPFEEFINNTAMSYAGLGVIMATCATIFKRLNKKLHYAYIICAAYYTIIAIEAVMGYSGVFRPLYTPFTFLMTVIIIRFSWGYDGYIRGCIKRRFGDNDNRCFSGVGWNDDSERTL